MLKQGKGAIVNISSIAACRTSTLPAYAASKGLDSDQSLASTTPRRHSLQRLNPDSSIRQMAASVESNPEQLNPFCRTILSVSRKTEGWRYGLLSGLGPRQLVTGELFSIDEG